MHFQGLSPVRDLLEELKLFFFKIFGQVDCFFLFFLKGDGGIFGLLNSPTSTPSENYNFQNVWKLMYKMSVEIIK